MELLCIIIGVANESKEESGLFIKRFHKDDLSNFEPLPVKVLDGIPVLTDGHTRAVSAILAGLE